jgi:excisionase family DNA binding protein
MTQPPEGLISVSEILAYINRDRYLALAEACKYLSLSERTLRELLSGIKHYRIGRKLLFRQSELDAWVAMHQEKSADLDIDALAEAAMKDILGTKYNKKLGSQ